MTDCLTPPEHYRPALSLIETEIALKTVKDTFERCLARNLSLTRVSAPLFVRTGTGLNDDLSGTERPVAFDVPSLRRGVSDRAFSRQMEAHGA